MKLIKNLLLIAILVFAAIRFAPNHVKQIGAPFDRWLNFSFCDRPIKYRIGSIDPKFDVTKELFANVIAEAAEIWNKEHGKPLFIRDDNGELEINLVYDGRQAIVTAINQIDSSVEQQKQRLETQNGTFDQVKAKLEAEIKKLNDQIDYWNSKGGAPEKEYNELVAKQKSIKRQIDELNKTANQINNDVAKINNQVHDLNTNVGNFNSIIKINPEVGVYTSGINKIDIFFFGSHQELVHVLAHEMGHGLGLGHVEGKDSMMNPTTSGNLKLTAADTSELTNVCTNKNRLDLIKNDIVNYVYSLISKLQQSK